MREGPGVRVAASFALPIRRRVLLAGLIAGKEKLVTLYQQAALSDVKLAPALQPFQQRHLAHLAALRRHLPKPGSPAATPTPWSIRR